MGWSCARMAAFRLDAISNACYKQTGIQNEYRVGDYEYRVGDSPSDICRYMWERSNKEHSDGAITGTIWRFTGIEGRIAKSGSFRIEGDGTITRGPAFFKDAPCIILEVDGVPCLWGDKLIPEDIHQWIKDDWMKQYMPGGINEHCTKARGFLGMPYPNKVEFKDLRTNKVVAAWIASTFTVW